MNYILEINEFYRWLEANPIPSTAINLWHALMNINNSSKWKRSFSAAISTLESKTGYDRKAIFRARQTLTDAGRLKWETRGSKTSACYVLIPFINDGSNATVPPMKGADKVPEQGLQISSDKSPDKGPHEGTDDGLNSKEKEKENEKENKEGESEDSMSSGDDVQNSVQYVFDQFNVICKNVIPVKLLTEKRRLYIGARLRDHGLKNVIKMMEVASRSDFLAGSNRNKWIATIDWMFRPNNFVKVLEGNYDNRPERHSSENYNSRPSNLEIIEETYYNLYENEGTFYRR